MRKPAWEIAHCAIRAKERYGILLEWDDLLALAKLCREKKGFLRLEGKTEHHGVVYRERVLEVCFNPEAGIIVTILPPDAIGQKVARAHDDWVKHRKRRGRYKPTRSFFR